MYYKKELGNAGEERACKYLEEKKYKIIERNFSCKLGEIDIIARDKRELVFVEVKTRTNTEYGLPSEAVTKGKIKHLLNTISYYLYIKKIENKNIRIDVIEIYKSENKINHLKQII